MLPKTTVAVEDEARRRSSRLMDALEENDDVQAVYANFDIPRGILEAVAAWARPSEAAPILPVR